MPKFAKFLWRILQHRKSSTSSLNLCAPNKVSQISVGSNQDEAEIQHDRWSTQEWYNCEKCEKMSTNLECMRCHEILAVKVFHLKFKARLSWNKSVLEFFATEFNCVGNHFLEEFFSEISKKSFLSLSFNIFKMTPLFRYFPVILSLLQ